MRAGTAPLKWQRGGCSAAATSLKGLSTARKRGFETAIQIQPKHFVAVQALDAGGKVLAQSAIVHVR